MYLPYSRLKKDVYIVLRVLPALDAPFILFDSLEFLISRSDRQGANFSGVTVAAFFTFLMLAEI